MSLMSQAFSLNVPAELGDKTQFVVLALATQVCGPDGPRRGRRRHPPRGVSHPPWQGPRGHALPRGVGTAPRRWNFVSMGLAAFRGAAAELPGGGD